MAFRINRGAIHTVTISVLFVHHSGTFGGASRSMLEMIKALPAGTVLPYLITPRGNVAAAAERLGVPSLVTRGISQFDCTRFGHYRGARWLLLLRELWLVPFTIAALLRAKFRWKSIQIVHVNDITPLLAIVIAKLLFRTPLVVHVRSVMVKTGMPLRRCLLRKIFRQHVDKVIAIDETVKASLPDDFYATVVHNGFALHAPKDIGSHAELPPALVHEGFKIAMVGNLLPMKGVREFVQAARICLKKGLDIHFFLVGDNVRRLSGIYGWLLKRLDFAQDVRSDTENFVRTHAMGERVHLIGFMSNIKDVYDRINVLCFPSHLNAAGRPVFEAAFSRVPSIVAIENPYGDTIVDGETGLCIKAGDPTVLADAIEYFYKHRAENVRMGEAAYRLAHRNFDIQNNAALVLEIYRSLVTSDIPAVATIPP